MERRRGSLIATASVQGGSVDNDFYNPNPNYLTIVALEDGLTASLSTNDVEYSIDGNDNWTTLSAGTASPAINKNHYISFRGNLTPTSSGIGTFGISKLCNLTGNCNSLLFGDDAANNLDLTGRDYAFRNLFYNCSTIKNISPDFLPATTLADYCYYMMFYCAFSSKLSTAPKLPAITLASHCYKGMFMRCFSLTIPPELPATTLADSCYAEMFLQCTSLTTAPQLPATTLAEWCYSRMFEGCSALTTSPELPATTLAEDCYRSMFSGTNVLPDCSNINFSSSTVVASLGLRGLFAGTKVTDSDLRSILPINSDGKYYLPCTTLASNCYESMFEGCTLLLTAPELPATTLRGWCYNRMFEGCSSLVVAPKLPATTVV